MSRRFFFAIRYLPAQADSALLAGRCITTLHGFLLGHRDVQIGIAFPNWNDSALGRTVAFVSESRAHLEIFRQRAYFQSMYQDGLFGLSPVLEVPDDCSEVRFIRNQNLAKLFVGERKRRLARSKRRAEARGEEFLPSVPAENMDVGLFHSALLQSHTNQQTYVLHIQAQHCDRQNNNLDFSHFGLASPDKYRGTVPMLTAIVNTLF
ncbi:type I-F CRISPR-associated endoribonuclease Cas6/Csy4 [Pseudaeromonas sp. ZJS20]|uniref:type I-F CRISPR-associated endoribonuclease Cas6/Csy4 n=1 Tax=Pseudaeromonas aegiceratis TaxID=3153928 RepID=UPI00390C890E